MGIVHQSSLEWRIVNGLIVVTPIPPDPVQAAVGILEGWGLTTEDLLAERKRDHQPTQDEEST